MFRTLLASWQSTYSDLPHLLLQFASKFLLLKACCRAVELIFERKEFVALSMLANRQEALGESIHLLTDLCLFALFE